MNDIETALSQVDGFQFIHEHLFCSALLSAEELKNIKEYGVSTIINVAMSDAPKHLVHVDKICLELGLNYIKMPISADAPSDDQCLLVLDLLDHLVKEQVVWLQGADISHISCLIYLYRQYYMGVDMPTAQELMHQVWEPNETWTGLIHAIALQLQGRKATQELQHSLINPNHFV